MVAGARFDQRLEMPMLSVTTKSVGLGRREFKSPRFFNQSNQRLTGTNLLFDLGTA